MKIKTNIHIEEKLWKKHSGISKIIKNAIQIAVNDTILKQTNKNFEVSLLLTDDQKIQQLNKIYRQKDQTTNVLSFPLFDGKKIKNGNFNKIIDQLNLVNPYGLCHNLGDIAFSYQTLEKEAIEQQKSFIDHLTHLVIHGFLHLIGFDHIKKRDAEIMEKLEIDILSKIGIKNPY